MKEAIRKAVTSPRFPIFLIFIGIFLRLNFYLYDGVLWLDEAWVANDLSYRSLIEVFTSEYYFKPVPIGIAFITKVNVLLLGENGYALRLFPFLCGVGSLFLYYELLKRIVSPGVLPIALAFFVFSEPLINYSAELKYYSTDILFTLLIFLFTFRPAITKLTYSQMIALSSTGAVALWFTHTPIFLMTSIVMVGIWMFWRNQEKEKCLKFLFIQGIWLASFAVVYMLSLKLVNRFELLRDWWEGSFWPMPPWTMESLFWLKDAAWKFFKDPVWLNLPLLSLFIFSVGVYVVYKKRRDLLLIFLVPMFLVLLASAIRKYPFEGRVLIFLLPGVFVIMSEGIMFMAQRCKWWLTSILCVLLVASIPFKQISHPTHTIRFKEDIRPLMQMLKVSQEKGDHIFLNNSAYDEFWYYSRQYKFDYTPKMQGLLEMTIFNTEKNRYVAFIPIIFYQETSETRPLLQKLPPKILSPTQASEKVSAHNRVWFLFSRADDAAEELFLQSLDLQAKRVTELKSHGASLYLYNFKK